MGSYAAGERMGRTGAEVAEEPLVEGALRPLSAGAWHFKWVTPLGLGGETKEPALWM